MATNQPLKQTWLPAIGQWNHTSTDLEPQHGLGSHSELEAFIGQPPKPKKKQDCITHGDKQANKYIFQELANGIILALIGSLSHGR